jgi:hypothetical protein
MRQQVSLKIADHPPAIRLSSLNAACQGAYHSLDTPVTRKGQRMPELPVKGIIPISQMIGDDEEETRLLHELSERAQAFLSSFAWCVSISEFYFGDGIGGIFGVFFARIQPARPAIDDFLWVIVGDLPSAYLVTDACKTPSQAMDAYIEEMRKWIALAKKGETSRNVIPVNVPATPEWAKVLEGRLDTLQHEILPGFFGE